MPVNLRQQSRQYLMAAAQETTLALKRRLASHALALAMVAERIELEEAGRQRVPTRIDQTFL